MRHLRDLAGAGLVMLTLAVLVTLGAWLVEPLVP